MTRHQGGVNLRGMIVHDVLAWLADVLLGGEAREFLAPLLPRRRPNAGRGLRRKKR